MIKYKYAVEYENSIKIYKTELLVLFLASYCLFQSIRNHATKDVNLLNASVSKNMFSGFKIEVILPSSFYGE